ncbi:MAG: hypothetical protein NVS9B10_08590 [Nevskia sp.]
MPSLPHPYPPLHRLRDRRLGRVLAVALALTLPVLLSLPAQAGPGVPSYDLASVLPKSSLTPLLSKIVFQNSNAVDDDDEQELGAGLFDRPPPLLAPDLTRFDEMAGHHLRWHYDDSWSSSFGSDFPKIRTPGYLVGNGAPGVTQKIWFQFSISRSF